MSLIDHQTIQNECKWITKDYLNEILSNYLKYTKIQVLDYHLSAPLKKGENYGSQIFRGLIKYSTDKNQEASLSIIIKSSFLNKEIGTNV